MSAYTTKYVTEEEAAKKIKAGLSRLGREGLEEVLNEVARQAGSYNRYQITGSVPPDPEEEI